KRLDIVEGLYHNFMARDAVRETLKSVYDLERLAGRIAFGNVNARDLIQLKQSLLNVPTLKTTLKQFDHHLIVELGAALIYPERLVDVLANRLVDDSPLASKEGSIIREGYHEKLDTYRDASRNGKQWIAALEQQEKEATNIRSLKIGYNRVFG